ncbi:hypothetical protein FA15DRAFT_630990 [Coprinopsis marcescibilis]|uniref:Uncharacterized protein n=1 Tax=Coprinopsis marcescibilis TaxID=230819 RepID=A0A5C3LBG0_COPMA|nr:hypothetical protein FA15DRAFT_630990 [Coprinopsis marcescibilis]
MLDHRGFSAWITVDEQPLPEYLVAVDAETHRVSCWIPGEEGQTFKVWWHDHGGKVDTCSFVVLDGLVVPGRFLFGEGVASRSGIRASHMTEKPFIFTKVPQKSEPGEETNKDAGSIVLKIKRIKRTEGRPSNPVQQVTSVAASGKKPVGDLCIGFGQEMSTALQYHATWSVAPYDNDKSGATKPSTYVSFVFRYRSSEFLESQGIASNIKRTIAPKVGDKRRISSVPQLQSLANTLATPSPSPPKRPRLTEPTLLTDQGALATRRTPSYNEGRRTASWKAQHPDNATYQGVFIIPKPQSYDGATILNTLLPSCNSSDTSADDDLT